MLNRLKMKIEFAGEVARNALSVRMTFSELPLGHFNEHFLKSREVFEKLQWNRVVLKALAFQSRIEKFLLHKST